MNLSFQPSRAPASDALPSFRVARLWRHEAGLDTEISHLIDRTYDYASVRELRWHLADRLAQPVAALALRKV